jgi:hypothetical protein
MNVKGMKIADLRNAAQHLYQLKDLAKNSPDHIGVFTGLNGNTLSEALRHKATFVLGSPTLLTRIMQDNKFYNIFKVADGVELYDEKGRERKHTGLTGYLGDVPVHIHPLNTKWVDPVVDQGFQEWDLIYMYPKTNV